MKVFLALHFFNDTNTDLHTPQKRKTPQRQVQQHSKARNKTKRQLQFNRNNKPGPRRAVSNVDLSGNIYIPQEEQGKSKIPSKRFPRNSKENVRKSRDSTSYMQMHEKKQRVQNQNESAPLSKRKQKNIDNREGTANPIEELQVLKHLKRKLKRKTDGRSLNISSISETDPPLLSSPFQDYKQGSSTTKMSSPKEKKRKTPVKSRKVDIRNKQGPKKKLQFKKPIQATKKILQPKSNKTKPKSKKLKRQLKPEKTGVESRRGPNRKEKSRPTTLPAQNAAAAQSNMFFSTHQYQTLHNKLSKLKADLNEQQRKNELDELDDAEGQASVT